MCGSHRLLIEADLVFWWLESLPTIATAISTNFALAASELVLFDLHCRKQTGLLISNFKLGFPFSIHWLWSASTNGQLRTLWFLIETIPRGSLSTATGLFLQPFYGGPTSLWQRAPEIFPSSPQNQEARSLLSTKVLWVSPEVSNSL